MMSGIIICIFFQDIPGTVSDGHTEKKEKIPQEYIAGCDNASYMELDCPHYVHDYKYEKISKEIRNFIK